LLAIGAGLLSWGLGDIYWTLFLADLETIPYPSPADALYVGHYFGLFVGVVLLLGPRIPRFSVGLWIDGAIGALAVAAAGAALLYPAIESAASAAIAINLTYPLADLLLLAFLTGAVALTGWQPGRSFGLIAGGLAMTTIADSVYLYQEATSGYTEGTWLDSMWLAGAVLVAIAAWGPRQRPSGVALDGLKPIVVPTFFALMVVGLQGYGEFAQLNRIAGLLATAALAVVVLRVVLTFRDNSKLLEVVSQDAVTDQLTQLGNRRQLLQDLWAITHRPDDQTSHVLVLFDLDGFKNYNDTFGHPAGDLLLAQLGEKLGDTVGRERAYRLGGDEFCVLSTTTRQSAGMIAAKASEALTAQGEGFKIGASSGFALLPAEADTSEKALRLADERLYVDKTRRPTSANRQMRDVLIRTINERAPELYASLDGVEHLVVSLGRTARLDAEELDVAVRAAELQYIGKMAIPDEILNKTGELSELEWELMREYTVIGERILNAAPALAPVGKVVRSSLEHWDGSGYPDRLSGEQIPLPARVISLCTAFYAMTSDRPYRPALTDQEALLEIRRGAGTQFDPQLVQDFCGWAYPATRGAALSRASEQAQA
jgi:diguanylate cyclase (GGDEF)-like protein